MRVLVTGGNGFIGRYVVEKLQDREHEIAVLDRHRDAESHIETYLGDVRDLTAVHEAVSTCDGVIHLAGVLGTQETIQEPTPAIETNIHGSINVFKAIRDFDLPCVYISVGNHWMNNPYSISKSTAERFAFMFNREAGTRIHVVRALNAYGPHQKSYPVRKIMPTFIKSVLEGKPIEIYGDGKQVMDMVWVGDVADILVTALVDDVKWDPMHKVDAGTGVATTVNDVAETVIRVMGEGKIEHVPMRPGEPEGSVVLADPRTLDGLWDDAFMPLELGVKLTVASYRGT